VIDRRADCASDNLAETALDNIETANPFIFTSSANAPCIPRFRIPESVDLDPETIDRSIDPSIDPWLFVFANRRSFIRA